MRYVDIPAPVQACNREGVPYKDAPINTAWTVVRDLVVLSGSPLFGKGLEAVRREKKLKRALEKAKEGTQAGIEDADWQAVWDVLKDYDWKPGQMELMAQLDEFLEAWHPDNAKTSPRELKSVPAEPVAASAT